MCKNSIVNEFIFLFGCVGVWVSEEGGNLFIDLVVVNIVLLLFMWVDYLGDIFVLF